MTKLENLPVAVGVYLIDKPVGPTSFRMVHLVRKALGIKKVGHTGTLDPFASGLLIICAGRPATKMISQLMAGDKVYEAVLRLGVETDTLDTEGKVVAQQPVTGVNNTVVEECLQSFMGQQMQAPPAFSAVKHKGKPLYHYARQGIMIEKAPREIVIHDLRCLQFDLDKDELIIRVNCSKGTYIRTLASDIGRKLGCGAHLQALRRLNNGPFSVEQAIAGDDLVDSRQAKEILLATVLPVEQALAMMPHANNEMIGC